MTGSSKQMGNNNLPMDSQMARLVSMCFPYKKSNSPQTHMPLNNSFLTKTQISQYMMLISTMLKVDPKAAKNQANLRKTS